MKTTNISDRLVFLAEQFDVFENVDDGIIDVVEDKINQLKGEGFSSRVIKTNETVIGLISVKENAKNRILKKISVGSSVFSDMIREDPTDNKVFVQWMLNVFSRFLKDGDKDSIDKAIRFVSEDLPQAGVYLTLFENNKRKVKFKELCLGSQTLKHITDPTNINQFDSLSQLFDAVDPFIEREPSAIERTMNKYVSNGQAIIAVKDRKFTCFIPKSTAANVIFEHFANWCTAMNGNGMFKSYTTNHKKPNGRNSDIYIIINNKFFSGESDEIYQIHFETSQFKDRRNAENVSLYENVISKSEALNKFFYEELIDMAKESKKNFSDNVYLKALIKFGFSESYFEMFPKETKSINIKDVDIPKLPNLETFMDLEELIMIRTNLCEIHPSIGKLTNMEILALPYNKISQIPKEIGLLKKLVFINLVGNKISEIPEEISQLDKSNGGSLYKIAIKEEDIGKENLLRLKKLLPTTEIANKNN